jgi:hypothetical protein
MSNYQKIRQNRSSAVSVIIKPIIKIGKLVVIADRLCCVVVKVPGYRFRGPGSIQGATRFFLRSSGSGTGSTPPRDDN